MKASGLFRGWPKDSGVHRIHISEKCWGVGTARSSVRAKKRRWMIRGTRFRAGFVFTFVEKDKTRWAFTAQPARITHLFNAPPKELQAYFPTTRMPRQTLRKGNIDPSAL
jgi:hypothetical protein